MKIKEILWWAIPLVLLVALVLWVFTLPRKEGTKIMPQGVHWHATLAIKIKGEAVSIPGNIGLGPVSQPTHTHEPDGRLHFHAWPGGVLRESDLTLKRFFSLWGKDFSRESLMENKTGPDGTVHMFVNGTENFDFEKYNIQDGDRIELTYE